MSERVLYLGRLVPVVGFRTYIYDTQSTPKLVNSWAEYQDHIMTGVWFDTVEKAKEKGFKKKGKE